MALDFEIPYLEATDGNGLLITMIEHQQLLGIAAPQTSPLLSRLNDYYEDARFSHDELATLKDEIKVLREKPSIPPELEGFLIRLFTFVELATKYGRGINVVAD